MFPVIFITSPPFAFVNSFASSSEVDTFIELSAGGVIEPPPPPPVDPPGLFPSTFGVSVPVIGLDIVPSFSTFVPSPSFLTSVIVPLFSTLTFSELELTSTLLILPAEVFVTVVFLPFSTTKVPIVPLFLISAFGVLTVTFPVKSPFTCLSYQLKYL